MTNDLFRTEEERYVALTEEEQHHVLKIDPFFESVSEAAYFDNYDLPCPIRVRVKTKAGEPVTVVLRKARYGDVNKEVQMFQALSDTELPVPEVLGGPFALRDNQHAAVYSLLPGESLQKLAMRSDEDLHMAKDLLIRAVTRLMDATELIEAREVSKILPRITLASQLGALITEANTWLGEEVFRAAVRKLENVIETIATPLVLSNGDYQPGNFLARDGMITGYLDFESACFQDPLIGFVKYPICDLVPLSRTEVVNTFLESTGFSTREFSYRLALGCLITLHDQIPVVGGDQEMRDYRERVLGLLAATQLS